eukprot:gene7503-1341_t
MSSIALGSPRHMASVPDEAPRPGTLAQDKTMDLWDLIHSAAPGSPTPVATDKEGFLPTLPPKGPRAPSFLLSTSSLVSLPYRPPSLGLYGSCESPQPDMPLPSDKPGTPNAVLASYGVAGSPPPLQPHLQSAPRAPEWLFSDTMATGTTTGSASPTTAERQYSSPGPQSTNQGVSSQALSGTSQIPHRTDDTCTGYQSLGPPQATETCDSACSGRVLGSTCSESPPEAKAHPACTPASVTGLEPSASVPLLANGTGGSAQYLPETVTGTLSMSASQLTSLLSASQIAPDIPKATWKGQALDQESPLESSHQPLELSPRPHPPPFSPAPSSGGTPPHPIVQTCAVNDPMDSYSPMLLTPLDSGAVVSSQPMGLDVTTPHEPVAVTASSASNSTPVFHDALSPSAAWPLQSPGLLPVTTSVTADLLSDSIQ